MATLYSSLYDDDTNAYKGPYAERNGQVVGVYGTITDTIDGTNSEVRLFEVPAGAKVLRCSILAGSDLDSGNDFTFNLGYSGAATGFLSASTGLQATTVVTEAPSDTFAVTAASAGDAFELNRSAGDISAGTIYFFAEYVVP